MHEDFLPGGYRLRVQPGIFPLGQDSVLLADFARVPRRAHILDLGCGAGTLALILLGRYPQVTACALDFDAAACTQTTENMQINALEDRMQVLHADARQARRVLHTGEFDFVICNPPYFSTSAGKSHTSLASARQQQADTLEAMCAAAAFALRQRGKLAMVYRPERLETLFSTLAQAGFAVKRLRFVHQHSESAPSAVLLEAMKDGREGICVLPPLCIRDAQGAYTADYLRAYGRTDSSCIGEQKE